MSAHLAPRATRSIRAETAGSSGLALGPNQRGKAGGEVEASTPVMAMAHQRTRGKGPPANMAPNLAATPLDRGDAGATCLGLAPYVRRPGVAAHVVSVCVRMCAPALDGSLVQRFGTTNRCVGAFRRPAGNHLALAARDQPSRNRERRAADLAVREAPTDCPGAASRCLGVLEEQCVVRPEPAQLN
jgi:hypothetical protein